MFRIFVRINIIFLQVINWFVSITETECVNSEVATEIFWILYGLTLHLIMGDETESMTVVDAVNSAWCRPANTDFSEQTQDKRATQESLVNTYQFRYVMRIVTTR